MRSWGKGTCIDGNLAQSVNIVKFRNTTVLLSFLLFFGCDNDSTDDPERLDSSEGNVSLIPKIIEPEVATSPAPPESPVPPTKPSLPVPPPPPVAPEGPRAPAFTKELLASVKDWNAVPPSVFPLSGVTLKKPLNFEIKTPSGQVMGSFPRAAGDEVVALALTGDQLHVSPAKTSKQRNILSVDETDFKTCVAYLYEVRKSQRKAYEEELVRRNSIASSQHSPSARKPAHSPSENIKNSSGRGTLFEDIPPPKDFGHGKFCICGDCRRQRKAAQK
jgi:hypothetical protein